MIWPLFLEKSLLAGADERQSSIASFRSGSRTVIQRNFQQQDLHHHHEKRLYQQRTVESGTGVVEYPAGGQSLAQDTFWRTWLGTEPSHLKKEATSMINGMSREKPALDLLRCMERAWSLYERIGDIIRKRGVQ